jgi:hypothetical protein
MSIENDVFSGNPLNQKVSWDNLRSNAQPVAYCSSVAWHQGEQCFKYEDELNK